VKQKTQKRSTKRCVITG